MVGKTETIKFWCQWCGLTNKLFCAWARGKIPHSLPMSQSSKSNKCVVGEEWGLWI